MSYSMKLERLEERRDRYRTVLADMRERIKRDAPPDGCYWMAGHRNTLYKFRELCDKALRSVEQEIESLRIVMELH